MGFITNSGSQGLSERLKELISVSNEIKILVGYFYFSALPVIYEELKKLYDEKKLNQEHLKVLVGLKVDRGLYGLYEVSTSENSGEQRIREFKKSLETALTSEELDSKELYQQAEFFLRLLEEGYMVLRKTKKPNHAKLYLFKLNEKGAKHSIITGSSNLTKYGLREQEEFNVEIRDYGFEEAERYFDKLWREAQEINPKDVVETIRQKTMLRWVEPYTAYAYLVKTYLDLHTLKEFSEEAVKSILEEAGFKPYSYQVHAVMEALSILKDHGGVILADVVGLGKTVIACAIAKLLDLKGIVIAPPHLVGEEEDRGWKDYLSRFGLYDWRVFSVGKLENVLEFVSKNPHYQVVIVDEAHRFRNEETQSYELLKAITTHRKVLLLTATPFNNRPEDIFAMLKLFTLPKKSTIVLDGDLQEKFKKFQDVFEELSYIKKYYLSKDKEKRKRALQKYEKLFGSTDVEVNEVDLSLKSIAQKIKGMISPVVIRRNRLDLRWYKEEIPLSQVKDPVVKFYKLSKDQSEFYDEVIQTFSSPEEGGSFVGALYMPERYLKGDQKDDFRELSQRNLYDFMRRLLVKRFESSFYAFNQSIKNFIQLHETAIEFVQKSRKYVLNRDLIEDLYTAEEETILKELKEFEESLKASSSPKGRYEYIYDETNADIDKLLEDLKRDKKLFENIQKKLEDSGLLEQDPKLEELSNTLREFIEQNRKVVIFSEYVDTAEYLAEKLQEMGFRVLKAVGSLSKGRLEEIRQNFDAQHEDKRDDYDVLVSTDKLSEGINLNRAGVVINYDIPWNPVRVIQRVGRINRIGQKVYEELYIVNFFPTEKGADQTRIVEIAKNKMFMIHKVLGEDAKIFTPDEEPTPSELYTRLSTYREDQEKSFYTIMLEEWERIKKETPDIEEKIKDMPNRVKCAKPSDKSELFVFVKKYGELFCIHCDYQKDQTQEVPLEEAFSRIKADPQTKSLSLSEHFWEFYKKVEDYTKERRKDYQDVEKSAIRNLKYFRDHIKDEFIDVLISAIQDYGVLPIKTLRDISNIKDKEEMEKYLEGIKRRFGTALQKLEQDQQSQKGEVIISIENKDVQ